jgi:hypothetical protein
MATGISSRVARAPLSTPRQGNETLTNWGRFRVEHIEESDRSATLSVGTELRFRAGHGTCIRDAYTTGRGRDTSNLHAPISGKRASAVMVGVSPHRRGPGSRHCSSTRARA